jgi:hypothetical protein
MASLDWFQFTSGTYNGHGQVEARMQHSVEATKTFNNTRLFFRYKPAWEDGAGLRLISRSIEPLADEWVRSMPHEAEDGERSGQRGRGTVALRARGEGPLAGFPRMYAHRDAAK